ncbi:MAG: protein-export chaperone SecB [Gammaproteobacteria bacterium]|nr:MAG: protein-export chaperone SecB [Gammaproteobacteria bacterium]
MTDTPQTDDGAGAAEGAQSPSFALQRIYVKDISFESPRAPEIFRNNWKPRINLDLNTRSQRLEDDVYEVVLTLSIEAGAEGEQTGFIVELQQAGVFHISGLDESQLQHTLASYCPNLLFPYARETVDTLVLKGSFPPLMLAPVNFDALYAEAMQRQQEGGDVAH